MSEWITDRRPKAEDVSIPHGCVFDGRGHIVHHALVMEGEPWKPIPKCEPYVNKPKRWVVREYVASRQYFVVEANSFDAPTIYALPTREAAERIAAIYEEVMP